MAYKYYILRNREVEFPDIFQVASETLIKAAHNYIPNGFAKFTTYANKCIENRLKSMLFPRKRKRITYEEFIDETLFKIDYLNYILKSSFKDKKAARTARQMLIRASLKIKESNRLQNLIGSPKGYRSRVNTKKFVDEPVETLEKIVYDIKKQLEFITTSEDIELINMYISMTGNQTYYIKYIRDKVYMMKIYLRVRTQLISKGIIPTVEEMRLALNEELKRQNTIKYKLRKGIISINLKDDDNVVKFDYDLMEELVKKEDLALYGKRHLKISAFNMYYGLNGYERHTLGQIVEILGLKIEPKSLSLHIKEVLISIEKYKIGIKSSEWYTYEQLLDYYINKKNTLTFDEQREIRLYLKRYKNRSKKEALNTIYMNRPLSFKIRYNLACYLYGKIIDVSNMSRQEIMSVLNNETRKISFNNRVLLSRHIGCSTKDVMRNKDKKTLLKIMVKMFKAREACKDQGQSSDFKSYGQVRPK